MTQPWNHEVIILPSISFLFTDGSIVILSGFIGCFSIYERMKRTGFSMPYHVGVLGTFISYHSMVVMKKQNFSI